ncbi:MAG: PIN domain-containing protein [Candidatus Helarchaeota archaeon]
MKKIEPKVLDAGVLIALAVGEKLASDIKKKIKNNELKAFCTELAILELTYILCRRIGWDDAVQKKEDLLRSGVIEVIKTEEILDKGARIKCKRSLALADCLSIALGEIYKIPVLFAKKEAELIKELKKNPFIIKIEFLEN